MNFFDGLPIYYINLDRQRDRSERLLQSFKECGIHEYRRISAIDGKQGRIKALLLDYHQPLNNPMSAIILSYFKLLQTFLRDEESDYILMCDDDCDFANVAKIDFNFYETLEVHNPEYYNLKTTALDRNTMIPPAKLHKPEVLLYGQSTIVNKKWAEMFLSKYGMLEGNVTLESVVDVRPYTSNYANSDPGWILPAADALNFDEHTYIWRVFSCFHTEDTELTPYGMSKEDYMQEINRNTNSNLLEQLTNRDIRLTLETFTRGIE